MKREVCPGCGSSHHKKNGHIHTGKQNYRCQACGRQFVAEPTAKTVTEATRALIKKALLERNSLRGICRIFDVSLTWLLALITELYDALPPDLGVNLQAVGGSPQVSLFVLTAEVDELWSFVGNKDNKQWVWIALDVKTRQVIAFHVGDRSKDSARQLWDKIPAAYREQATFHTDHYASYEDIIPKERHVTGIKGTGLTNHVERFNCTRRHRVSRLVRQSLAFSKKLQNHIGAIAYFICHYNQSRNPAALPM